MKLCELHVSHCDKHALPVSGTSHCGHLACMLNVNYNVQDGYGPDHHLFDREMQTETDSLATAATNIEACY